MHAKRRTADPHASGFNKRRRAMRRIRVAVTAGLAMVASFLAAPAAKAQAFQLCNTGDTYCTPATTTVDIGTTTSTNPTFDITFTGSANVTSVPVVDLVALIPDGSSVTPSNYTASFNSVTGGSPTALGEFNSSSSELWNVLGITKGADYNFSSFVGSTRGPDAGVTGFQVYEWSSIATDFSGSSQIAVSFSDGTSFPDGALFLAVGTDGNNNYVAKTPFTTTLAVSVPESGSKGMLFLSVLVLFGMFLRRPRWLQL